MVVLKAQKRRERDGSFSALPVGDDPKSEVRGSTAEVSGTNTAPKLRSIVAATDLSAGGTAAVNAGAALAKRSGARFSVISIVEPPQGQDLLHPAGPGMAGWVDFRQDEVRRDAEIELEEAGLGSTLLHIAVGDPVDLVASFAEKLQSDLVIVGAHRLSRYERVLAGSTGERLAQHSRCPVMVATRKGIGPFKRILAAVDLSPSSRAILDKANQLARCDGSEVRVLYSEERPENLWNKITLHGDWEHYKRKRQRFEGLVREAPFPGQPLTIVLHGHAGRAVLREAEKWDADLIVMGVRRLKFLFPNRLGRTARYVLRHGDRSIVVVPT